MKERNEVPETEKAFSQAIKRLRPQVREGQPIIDGKRVHAWIGLGMKGSAPDARHAHGDSQIMIIDSHKQEKEEEENRGSKANPVHPVHDMQAEVIDLAEEA
jgi:hypothetical protein